MDVTHYMQLGVALAFVLALMWLLSFILRKMNFAQSGLANKNARIKIIEQRMVDSKHKIAIIRCDDRDHLVILGQNGNTVIKAGMDIPPEKSKKDTPLESF